MGDLTVEIFCGGAFQTNGFLVRTPEAAWLFDAPEGIGDWIAEEGVRLSGLLLTHQHHDHVIGAGRVRELFDCPIWAHSPPSEDLTLASRLEEMTGMSCPLDPYSIDHELSGESKLSLEGLDLEILHVPGHSPDSICFRIGGSSFLIGGDVLFRGGIGRTDFPHGDHELLLRGIVEKLWPLPDDTQVLPGHGPATAIGIEKASNPFLQGLS